MLYGGCPPLLQRIAPLCFATALLITIGNRLCNPPVSLARVENFLVSSSCRCSSISAQRFHRCLPFRVLGTGPKVDGCVYEIVTVDGTASQTQTTLDSLSAVFHCTAWLARFSFKFCPAEEPMTVQLLCKYAVQSVQLEGSNKAMFTRTLNQRDTR